MKYLLIAFAVSLVVWAAVIWGISLALG